MPVQKQPAPGHQYKLDPQPLSEELPAYGGGQEKYKAAGKLKGRKALITGGDSGIGRSTAVLYAMEGADVAIAYLPDEQKDAEETKKLVEGYGQKAFLFPTDLKQAENCKKLADDARKALGTINILVNNHAYQNMTKDILDLSEEQWRFTFDTNIHPFFYLTKYVIGSMTKGDTVINNASINAYIGRPDLLDYTSTKGAIISFTRGISNQFVSKGIRCNAVAPGPVWTPLIPATMSEEAIEQFTAPMGRPSQPSEIATCFVFLASIDSSSISGQTIHANGGSVVNG